MTSHASLPSSLRDAAVASSLLIACIDPARDGEPVLLREPRDVLAALQELAVQRERICVHPEQDGPVAVGRLVSYVEARERFVVQVEHDGQPPSGEALIVAAPHGTKLQFAAELHWQAASTSTWRCEIALPPVLARTQRRRFTRQDVPMWPILQAVVLSTHRRHVLQVDNLSLGGVGLRGAASEHRDLHVQQRLDRVMLELSPAQSVEVSLEVCTRREFRSFLAGEQVHVGCRFVNLSPEARHTLEQFLAEVERAR